MKKTLIVLAVIIIFAVCITAYAQIQPNRESLYGAFGPKLIEAQMDLLLDEINILRAKAGLAPRTKEQMATALADRINEMPNYEWMSE